MPKGADRWFRRSNRGLDASTETAWFAPAHRSARERRTSIAAEGSKRMAFELTRQAIG